MTNELTNYALIIIAGFGAGVLNALAGGGPLITLAAIFAKIVPWLVMIATGIYAWSSFSPHMINRLCSGLCPLLRRNCSSRFMAAILVAVTAF